MLASVDDHVDRWSNGGDQLLFGADVAGPETLLKARAPKGGGESPQPAPRP